MNSPIKDWRKKISEKLVIRTAELIKKRLKTYKTRIVEVVKLRTYGDIKV